MICPECQSEKTGIKDKNYTKNKVRMQCHACGHRWSENREDQPKTLKPKNVLTMSDIKKRHDVDYRVMEALKNLKKDEFIEKEELIKRIGLRVGYPRLSATIDSYKEYFGKADSKIYWGHPEEIAILKEEGTFT